MIRRLFAPPSFPRVIRPDPAHRPKHVAPQNPSPHILECLQSHIVVDATAPASGPIHFLKDISLKKPGENLRPTNSKRIVEILPRPSPESINRNRKGSNANGTHTQ